MNKQLTTIEKFKKNVELLKKMIVNNLKEIDKLIKASKSPKSDNDKKAILNQISQRRLVVEQYRQALDDLTYAFIKNNPMIGLRVAKKFGYKTAEGYLADKENGIMPDLRTMIRLISNGSTYITRFYEFDYTSGKKEVKRNILGLEQDGMRRRNDTTRYDTYLATRETNQIANATINGSRHR